MPSINAHCNVELHCFARHTIARLCFARENLHSFTFWCKDSSPSYMDNVQVSSKNQCEISTLCDTDCHHCCLTASRWLLLSPTVCILGMTHLRDSHLSAQVDSPLKYAVPAGCHHAHLESSTSGSTPKNIPKGTYLGELCQRLNMKKKFWTCSGHVFHCFSGSSQKRPSAMF